MVTPVARLAEISREYERRANDFERIAVEAGQAEAEYRRVKAVFMAEAMVGGASAAKAGVLANADPEVSDACLVYKVSAATADAAKSKLTQLREQVATGRSVMVGEREADRLHAAGLSGAA